MYNLIGIDTSSNNCGYAIIDFEEELRNFGVIKAKSSLKLDKRLLLIASKLDFIIKANSGIIQNAQIEKPFSQFKTAESCLWQTVGAIKLTLSKNGISCNNAHVSCINKVWGIPQKTKREEKKQLTIEAVKKQFNLKDVESDAADAISLAYYGILKQRGEIK